MAFTVTKQIRALRHKQADARKAEYDKLSLEEKIRRLPEGGAKKQRARLESMRKPVAPKESAKAADSQEKGSKPNYQKKSKS